MILQPTRIMIHPEHNKPEKRDNDLALIFVESPGFNFTDFVKPICLWNSAYDFSLIENKTATVKPIFFPKTFYLTFKKVFGWGDTENQTQADILQEAKLKVEPHRDCYLKNRSFFGRYMKPGHNFCAGGTGMNVFLT
jgi:hypothetical protein